MRKPFFRSQTRNWYVRVNGKQVNLGRDKEAAFTRYHELMAGEQTVTPDITVHNLIGKYLDWCETNRDPKTYDWYRRYLLSFGEFVGAKLKLRSLKPGHVSDWLDKKYGHVNDNTKNNAVRAVVRAFNWAVRRRDIPENPLKGVERPQPRPREVYIAQAQWDEIIGCINAEDPLHDFLTILRETGCRPQEASRVEARHFDRANAQWAFPIGESKGKRYSRIVMLNAKALAITQRFALRHPEGPLFRTEMSKAWNRNNLSNRFIRLRKRLKMPGRVFCYALRHSFITDALVRGVDPITLARIVGHKDLTMISRVYNQLQSRQDHMRKALRIATGEAAAG